MLDLTGKQYGELLVLEEVKHSNNRHRYWKCQCSCGKIKIIRMDNLRSGNTTSCGHLKGCNKQQINRERGPSTRTLNHIGEKHGKLTIISIDNFKTNGNYLCNCQCDCGGFKKVLYQNLKTGMTTSCGCIKSKGEEKIGILLTNNHIPFVKEKHFESCCSSKTGGYYKFDFFVNNQYLIEYDGVQHFKENIRVNWDEPLEEIQFKDNEKTQWCKDNNIPLIRIPYTHLENICIEDLLIKTSNYLIS